MRPTRWPHHVLLLTLLTTGCTTVVKDIPVTTDDGRTPSLLSVTPIGPPTVTITASPQDWTVLVTQEHDLVQKETVQKREEVQRYAFTPYATIPGLLQCLVGTVQWTATAGHFGEERMKRGCLRVVMLEKLNGTAERPVFEQTNIVSAREQKPLQGALVRVLDQAQIIAWEGVLDHTGRVTITSRSLDHETRQQHPIVQIVSNGKTVATQTLPALPDTPRVNGDAPTWPTPLIAMIDTTEATLWAQVAHRLSQRGITVIAGTPDARVLDQEGLVMMTAKIDGPARPSIPRQAATVLVKATHTLTKNRNVTGLRVEFIDVKTGRVLEVEEKEQ